MRFRPLLLCLSLCATPLAAEPLRSGALRFSPAASARLAPRAADFMALLCSADEIEPPPPPPDSPDKNSARCCDKVSNKPPCEAMETAPPAFGIAAMQALEDGTLRASLFARTFELRGAKPIETRCGRWTWSLWLDPRATQPVSSLALRPAGTFSGALPLRARLEFAKVGSRRRVAVPVVVRLDMTGTWTVADAADDRLLLSIAGSKSLILPEGAEK